MKAMIATTPPTTPPTIALFDGPVLRAVVETMLPTLGLGEDDVTIAERVGTDDIRLLEWTAEVGAA